MAKINVIIKKEIELERGMIFKKGDNTYVLTIVEEEQYLLANTTTGKKYCRVGTLDCMAREITYDGLEYLGIGSDFKLVKKDWR